MNEVFDIYEFPRGYTGRRTYVGAKGHLKSIPVIYTYKGMDGRNYLHPDYGGNWDGYENYGHGVSAPMILRDMGEYVSPIDGSRVTSRSAHREHMQRHGVIEVGNERMPQAAPAPSTPDKDLGRLVKQHIDTVKSMPEKEYKARIETQVAQAAEVDI